MGKWDYMANHTTWLYLPERYDRKPPQNLLPWQIDHNQTENLHLDRLTSTKWAQPREMGKWDYICNINQSLCHITLVRYWPQLSGLSQEKWESGVPGPGSGGGQVLLRTSQSRRNNSIFMCICINRYVKRGYGQTAESQKQFQIWLICILTSLQASKLR